MTGTLPDSFSPTDFRAHAPRYTGQNREQNQKKIDLLAQMASEKGCTTTQLAIAWVNHRGDDIIPLIGTKNKDRLKDNLKALEVRLTSEEIQLLDESFPIGSFAGTRYPEQQMGMVVN